MDHALLRAINSLAGSPADAVGIFIATWLILFVFLFAAAPFLYGKGLLNAIRPLVAGGAAFFAAEIIKAIIRRPRPFFSIPDVTVLISKTASDWSFPSGHTSVAFAVAFTLYSFDKRLGRATLVLASLTALGRVFVGVHYPSDVLGGALLGYAVAYLVAKKR